MAMLTRCRNMKMSRKKRRRYVRQLYISGMYPVQYDFTFHGLDWQNNTSYSDPSHCRRVTSKTSSAYTLWYWRPKLTFLKQVLTVSMVFIFYIWFYIIFYSLFLSMLSPRVVFYWPVKLDQWVVSIKINYVHGLRTKDPFHKHTLRTILPQLIT